MTGIMGMADTAGVSLPPCHSFSSARSVELVAGGVTGAGPLLGCFNFLRFFFRCVVSVSPVVGVDAVLVGVDDIEDDGALQ